MILLENVLVNTDRKGQRLCTINNDDSKISDTQKSDGTVVVCENCIPVDHIN